SGRSTSVIPAVPAAWSVTTIAFMGIVSSVICLFAIFAKKSLLAMDCRVKPGNDGCASSRRMRRYREPFPVLLRPAIGAAPVRLLSVRRGVTERRMDDGEAAHDADLYIMRLQILDRHTGFAVCSRKAARSTRDL